MTARDPIHVVELAQTLCLGGLERTIYTLSHGLHDNKRFKVLVATYEHPDGAPSLIPQFTQAGIPLVQWQKGKGFSFRSVYQLVHLTFAEGTRVLHVHDLGPLIYGSFAKVFSLGRLRLVLTLHTLLDIVNNPRYRLYYKLFLRFPDRIIAVSPGVKSGLMALGVPSERIDVIPNGVSFSRDRMGGTAKKSTLRRTIQPKLPDTLHAARWILCLARLHSGKGQDVVLDVWKSLSPAARSEFTLFFVGQETEAGYTETLRRRIRTMPDPDRIIVAGASERPQEWIEASDIFISGSLLEGMPLAPLEAAGQGLPTLLSDIEGHRFLQPWASYFDPRNPEEGAQKLRDILESLKGDAETQFLENRWNAAASLRQSWGTSTMTDSYANAFETA